MIPIVSIPLDKSIIALIITKMKGIVIKIFLINSSNVYNETYLVFSL